VLALANFTAAAAERSERTLGKPGTDINFHDYNAVKQAPASLKS